MFLDIYACMMWWLRGNPQCALCLMVIGIGLLLSPDWSDNICCES